MEGIGVEPDIVVDNDPAREYAGIDDQLNKAIEVVPEELKTKERDVPPIPPYPVKNNCCPKFAGPQARPGQRIVILL